MIRGNLIGSRNYSTTDKAHGVWSMQEQYLSIRQQIWPADFINKTGLVLYLNAALSASYSGTGTQWTDLSGNNNHGTLVGSPTYSAASLDANGKVPVSELPNSVMEYQGTWTPVSNTPTLADGTGSAGDVYRVSAHHLQQLVALASSY